MANTRKKNLPPPKAPRDLKEIQSSYGEVTSKAGQLQYQIKIFSKELDKLNNHLEELNYEAAARQKLDASKPPEGEVKNEQL